MISLYTKFMINIKLKELRTEKGWRQKDIAQKLGISTQVYGNYENWINKPDPEMLLRMADLFDVSVDFLLGRETDLFGERTADTDKRKRNDDEFVTEVDLLRLDSEMLSTFRKLNTNQKRLLLQVAQSWVELNKK